MDLGKKQLRNKSICICISNKTKTVTTDILLQVFRVRKFSMEFTLILDATFNLQDITTPGKRWEVGLH